MMYSKSFTNDYNFGKLMEIDLLKKLKQMVPSITPTQDKFEKYDFIDDSKNIYELKTRLKWSYKSFDTHMVGYKKIESYFEMKANGMINDAYLLWYFPRDDILLKHKINFDCIDDYVIHSRYFQRNDRNRGELSCYIPIEWIEKIYL